MQAVAAPRPFQRARWAGEVSARRGSKPAAPRRCARPSVDDDAVLIEPHVGDPLIRGEGGNAHVMPPELRPGDADEPNMRVSSFGRKPRLRGSATGSSHTWPMLRRGRRGRAAVSWLVALEVDSGSFDPEAVGIARLLRPVTESLPPPAKNSSLFAAIPSSAARSLSPHRLHLRPQILRDLHRAELRARTWSRNARPCGRPSGRVSSWKARAVSGSSDRLNWSCPAEVEAGAARASSRSCAAGWPLARSAAWAAIL
jgi:hypothetical protein